MTAALPPPSHEAPPIEPEAPAHGDARPPVEDRKGVSGDELEDSRAPLLDHLLELRRRLLWSLLALGAAFAVCIYLARPILKFLVAPLQVAGQKNIINTDIFGGFFVELKVGFFAALMLGLPRDREPAVAVHRPRPSTRRSGAPLLPFLLATPVLFIMGASLAYYVAIPTALHFLLSFQGDLGGVTQQALPDVNSYLKFVMQFIFGFGLAFLLPVLLMLLERGGIVTRKQLIGARRYAIVGAFAISAVLTPPDIGSQLMLAIPLVILYEIALIGIWFTERKRARDVIVDGSTPA